MTIWHTTICGFLSFWTSSTDVSGARIAGSYALGACVLQGQQHGRSSTTRAPGKRPAEWQEMTIWHTTICGFLSFWTSSTASLPLPSHFPMGVLPWVHAGPLRGFPAPRRARRAAARDSVGKPWTCPHESHFFFPIFAAILAAAARDRLDPWNRTRLAQAAAPIARRPPHPTGRGRRRTAVRSATRRHWRETLVSANLGFGRARRLGAGGESARPRRTCRMPCGGRAGFARRPRLFGPSRRGRFHFFRFCT